ncbi:MAG: transposase [Spirochaetales bacterium]|nr:transposase [Spirochaetales bacterium]
MSLYRDQYRIESARLVGWDYSVGGYYFITICTHNSIDYFGDIKNRKMVLSKIGRIAHNYWQEIPSRFPYCKLDEFIIMTNHLHGILTINDVNDPRRDAIHRVSPITQNVSHIDKIDNPTNKMAPKITKNPNQKGGITGNNNPMLNKSISKIIRWYKGRCTFEINKLYTHAHFSWHPRFYDSVIRTEQDLMRIRRYIQNNPVE